MASLRFYRSVVVLLFLISLCYISLTSKLSTSHISRINPLQRLVSHTDTLVVFAYYECDGPWCKRDLEYFLKVAVWKDSGADYFVVVNGACSICDKPELKDFPNLRFVYRENESFDFGGYSYVLRNFDIEKYSYFVFLNAGTIGPIVPRYDLRNLRFWHRRFTDMLRGDVALVGPSFSCEAFPHVQSYCFALDRRGLDISLANGVFPRGRVAWMDNLIFSSELGMTQQIIKAGLNVDTFMAEYAGIDWRNPPANMTKCNNKRNPTISGRYHNTDLNIYESMFFKIGGSMRRFCTNHTSCSYDEPIRLATTFIERYVDLYRKGLVDQY